MELLNQIVIHKLWGEGFVSCHDASGFFVTFGGEEKPFSYPDSFAAFLRFADPQLQKDTEALLAKKQRRSPRQWPPGTPLRMCKRSTVHPLEEHRRKSKSPISLLSVISVMAVVTNITLAIWVPVQISRSSITFRLPITAGVATRIALVASI